MPERDASQPTYHIGAMAELTAVHPQTLRAYERLGLLSPARSRGRTRLYSEQDVERVKLIVHLTRDEQINLAGVAKILDLHERIREIEADLQRWMRQWHEHLQREPLERHERGGTIRIAVQRG